MRELDERLAALEARDRRRRLAPPVGVDLTSNDVLDLSTDPVVRDALADALARGVPHGGGASRLLTGEHPVWATLEARFADWQGAEAALFHATGFAANTGLLGAVIGPEDVVISDALNHASLIDGLRLTKAQRVVVPHDDPDAVDRALAEHAGRTAWVVSESVYSMDGDLPDLGRWAEVVTRHGARWIVDEAHATGLFGPSGQGRVVEAGVQDAVTARVHTCGKALGLMGAFVVADTSTIDWLVQRSRPFVFSTAPPPFLAAGLHAALDRVQGDAALRARPLALADRLRAALVPLDTGASASHVVPVIVGDDTTAVRVQRALADRGWDARAIRPPTVPEGTSRIRLVVRAGLTEGDVDRLAADVRAAVA